MLTRAEVLLGFRLLLGREPESERTIEAHSNHPNIMEFGRVLRESEEFRVRAARDRVASVERHRWVRSEVPSGLSLWVDLHDDGVSAGILSGNWEPAETNFMLSVVRPGDSVIDVGANLGWYTLTLAQALGPNGRVFAFEPRSDIFAQLERSVKDNGFTDRCTLYRIALGAEGGKRDLAWSPMEMNPGHSFILPEGGSPAPGLTRESVSFAPLDSIGIERRIRLIKLDVEGAEPDVLRGGRGLIARDRPIIVCEVFPKWLRRSGSTDTYSMLHLLDDLDYRAHYLTDDGIGGEVHWPLTDLESDYVYYSIVLLSAADRLALLDSRRDGRVQELEARNLAAERSMADLRQQAKVGEEHVAAAAADVQRLTDGLAAAEARVVEAERRATATTIEVERLTNELAVAVADARAAEQRARVAEFQNLETAGQALRGPKAPSTDRMERLQHELAEAQSLVQRLSNEIEALRCSTSWRVTAPLRAVRRAFARH
jgi:FkbM family methyltransferase